MMFAPMQESDLEEVVALEQSSFTEPWTRKMFLAELQGNVFSTNLLTRAEHGEWSGVSEGVLAGYIMFWIVFEELHLMNLAVRPALRRYGIGKELVGQALRIAAEKGAQTALLEVRASNVAAQGLYEGFGFKRKGLRRGYYEHPHEDAVIMVLEKGGDIMLSEEPAVLESVRKEHHEFKALEETHQRLEDQLAELAKLHILTPEEEIRKKQIQFEKLATKDKMAEIVRQFKHNRPMSAGRS
jgi:[ribosomal protein S18]-alanine N-acetyltransferase